MWFTTPFMVAISELFSPKKLKILSRKHVFNVKFDKIMSDFYVKRSQTCILAMINDIKYVQKESIFEIFLCLVPRCDHNLKK